MKRISKFVLSLLFLVIINLSNAQMTGIYNIPTDFATVAAATASMNSVGVAAPGVTINIPAGYTETLTSVISLSTTGTGSSPITFQKSGSGANPMLVAYSGGVGTPSTAVQDGVFRLVGSDYVTIDGLDILDPNGANPATMEYGYALYKMSATDGCQNNTIKNCVITLNRINNALGTAPSTDGSRGIDVINALPTANTSIVVVSAASGANSNNKFYSNTIQNCNIGIAMIGYAAASPFANADTGNDIGGSSAATGNTIINYGGGAAATNPAAGVRTLAQYNVNVSNNTVNNNNGGGVNHVAIMRGIYVNTAQSANTTISGNTLTINGGTTTAQISVIENVSGSTAASNTINITNNVITNCTNSLVTSGAFYGIYNNGTSPAFLNVNNNLISGVTFNTANSTGAANLIYISGTIASSLSIMSNTVQNVNVNTSGSIYGIYASNATNNFTVQNNYVNNIVRGPGLGGTMYGYYNFGAVSGGNSFLMNNMFTNMTGGNGASTFYGIYHATDVTQISTVANNTVSNNTGGTSTSYGIYFSYGAAGSIINNNIVSNLGAAGTVYGINVSGTSPAGLTVRNNTVNTISTTGAFSAIGILHASGVNTNIYKNKIYDIMANNAAGTVFGLQVSGLTTAITAHNNYIGDLKAPLTNNGVNAIVGIHLTAATANANLNIYYNTVYLSATSSGANFGTTGIQHTSNATATTAQLFLRNNIIINNSTPNGTGIVAAYRRSTSTLTNYNNASNNNNFYGGTPGPANLIYYDGVNAFQTISPYQALVTPRDAASISENTTFLSLVGSSPTYLHVDPSSGSLTESGAVNIGGITDDYDNDIRQGNAGYTGSGTAPDIGADEYNSILAACTGASSGTISPVSFNKCAGQTVSMSSTGFTTGSGIVYQWQVGTTSSGPYSNVTGGSGANSPAYTTGTLSAGTYYYVLVTTCTITSASNTSNEATVTINPVPTASASSNSPLCSGQNLNLTGGTDVGTTFMWTGPNSFTSSTQNPSITGATSAASGLYSFIVSTSNCTATPVTTSVTVNQTPTTITVTPTTATFCAGGSQTISATGGLVPNTMNMGTNTNTNTATTYPSPYSVYWGGQRMQFLVLATELSAAGFVANSPLTSLQFPVVSKGANWGTTMNDNKSFQVNIGTTTLTAINSFQAGLVNFVAASNYTPNVGYNNTHSFSTPFVWDGTSNVIFETTFSNNVAGVSADAVFTYTTATSFSATVIYRADNMTAAAIATTTTINEGPFMSRPDFKINGLAIGTYSWNPSSSLSAATGSTVTASPTSTTVYTVTVANGSCASMGNTTMNVVPAPTVAIAASNTTVCTPGSATLTASGATTYTWNTSATTAAIVITPSVPTTYTVTGDNGSCTATQTIGINTSASPSISASTSNTLSCTGQSVTLTSSGTATSFTWNTGANTSSIVVSPTTTTTYTITGANSAGCTAMAMVTQSVSTCIGIESISYSGIEVSIYPNPNNGMINVVIPGATTLNVIEIFDATGRMVLEKELNSVQSSIITTQLANGIYSFRIKNNDGIVKQGKLIKE